MHFGGVAVHVRAEHAFLFCLDCAGKPGLPHVLPIKDSSHYDHAMFLHNSTGPIFGSIVDPDLLIQNYPQSSFASYSHLGNRYTCPAGSGLHTSAACKAYLGGPGPTLKIADYAVFVLEVVESGCDAACGCGYTAATASINSTAGDKYGGVLRQNTTATGAGAACGVTCANRCATKPLAWYPCLSRSKHHVVCTEKAALDLIKLYSMPVKLGPVGAAPYLWTGIPAV